MFHKGLTQEIWLFYNCKNQRKITYNNLLPSFSSAVGILDKRVTAFVSPSAFFPVRSPDMLQREKERCYLKWNLNQGLSHTVDRSITYSSFKGNLEGKVQGFQLTSKGWPHLKCEKQALQDSALIFHSQNVLKIQDILLPLKI